MRKVRLDDFEELSASVLGARADGPQSCDTPGCAELGEFRAPRSPRQLNSYYWFCMDHVRQYNKAWNYYAGMSDEEVEAHIRLDTTWQRPTWPLGRRGTPPLHGSQDYLHDDYGFFEEDRARERENKAENESANARRWGLLSADQKAFEALELTPPVDMQTLRTKYKELVKLYHPDANGGDTEAEERLKIINEAYTTLKNSIAP